MKKYLVTVMEHATKTVIIEADNSEEANRKAGQAWGEGLIDMGYETEIDCEAREVETSDLEFYEEIKVELED